jgi:phage terminase large subunit-like protein
MPSVDEIYESLKIAYERRQFEAWRFFEAYPKQQEFMDYGSTYNERLLIAGNRVGKSDTGAFELSRHLTGIYPDNWRGKRFDHNSGPVKVWAAGPSGILVRDVAQTKLFGPPGVADLMGTGFIPRDAIVGQPSASRSAANAFDTAHIRHASGGVSHLGFKSYEQDRRIWQGETLQGIWFDEEPPLELYTEGQARLITTAGISFMTFTPLFGYSEVVKLYLDDDRAKNRISVQMALTDAKHMTPEMIERTLAAYPRHEWAARREGSPHLSGGRVFSTPEEQLAEPPFIFAGKDQPIDKYSQKVGPTPWQYIWGIDFGIDHPFAAVLLAYNPELGDGHVIACIKMSDQLVLQHCDAMKRIAENAPVAWPHDGHVRDRQSGEEMAYIYRKHGLHMLPEHAQYPNKSYSTEAGIMDLDTAMHAARFHVSNHLSEWFAEYRVYHRKLNEKTGIIELVKRNDDLMSATRQAWMQRRSAKQVPLGMGQAALPKREFIGAIINPFTGAPVT